MEVSAYTLLAIAALLGIVIGAIYGSHRILAIVLFGVAFLLTDISICMFWALKTEPSTDANAGKLSPATILFTTDGAEQ